MTTVEPSRKYESPLRDKQAAQTRDTIRKAVLDLLREGDEAALSMPEVAKRAGVSLRTVYRHFPTKVDLLRALLEVPNLRSSMLDATTPNELAHAVRGQFEMMAANEQLFRALNSTNAGREARHEGREVRRKPVVQSMAPVTARLDEESATKLMAVVNLLSSSAALFYMQELWDLTTEEAGDVAGWAISVLADRASRTKHVGLDPG